MCGYELVNAADRSCVPADEQSVSLSLHLVEEFRMFSGLKLNKCVTQACLGRLWENVHSCVHVCSHVFVRDYAFDSAS